MSSSSLAPPRGRRKIGLLALLYASQGIAPGFAAFAMPALLRQQGTSLQLLGWLGGALLLPVGLKFLLGPWSDRVASRGRLWPWMSGLQAVLAGCLMAIAAAPPERSLAVFLALVGTSYLVVAALDVLTDALAVRVLEPGERPAGNGAQYGGYYLGSVLAGGLFLAAEPVVGWVTAVGMLGLVVAGGWLAARELAPSLPGPAAEAPGVPGAPVAVSRASILAFLRGPSARHVLPLLLLLDLPQNVGIAQVVPFLVDLRFSQGVIGLVSGTLGLAAAFAGAATAGALLSRLPRVTALVTAGALQAVPLLGFAWLAARGVSSLALAIVVVTTAYFTASAFNVALSSWFMDRLSPRQPSTDYSLMSCAHILTFVVANPIAGASAGRLGFPSHFLLAAVSSLLLLAVAVPWLRHLEARRPAVATPATAVA
jgi:PAT family beta-lactamase induction signal transducer AmpG